MGKFITGGIKTGGTATIPFDEEEKGGFISGGLKTTVPTVTTPTTTPKFTGFKVPGLLPFEAIKTGLTAGVKSLPTLATTPLFDAQVPVLTPRNIKPLFTGKLQNIETTPVSPSALDLLLAVGIPAYQGVRGILSRAQFNQALANQLKKPIAESILRARAGAIPTTGEVVPTTEELLRRPAVTTRPIPTEKAVVPITPKPTPSITPYRPIFTGKVTAPITTPTPPQLQFKPTTLRAEKEGMGVEKWEEEQYKILRESIGKKSTPTEGKVELAQQPMAGGQPFTGKAMLKEGEALGGVKVVQTFKPTDIKDISGRKLEFGPNDTIFTYPIVNAKSGQFTGKIMVKDGDKGIVSQGQFQNLQGQNKPIVVSPEEAQVEEVVKGGLGVDKKRLEFRDRMYEKYEKDYPKIRTASRAQFEDILEGNEVEQWHRLNLAPITKFSQYQLPGGENYEEAVWKLPYKEDISIDENDPRIAPFAEKMKQGISLTAEENAVLEKIIAETPLPKAFYSHAYPEEKNNYGWARTNWRTDPQGKKVFFIEELQHVKPRELGGTDPITLEQYNTLPSFAKGNEFYKSALRKLIKKAIDGGADYISWTTGEQQAERYDLSKYIDTVHYLKNPDGSYHIRPEKSGQWILSNENVKKEDIGRTYGKQIEEMILGNKGETSLWNTNFKEFNVKDLKIGGEWAKNLYDRQIPNILKDLTKGEIGNIKFEYNPYQLDKRTGKMIDYQLTQPALMITPEIKARAIGQPMAGGRVSVPRKDLTKNEVFPDVMERLYRSEQEYIQKAIVEGKSDKQIAKELDEDITDTQKGINFAIDHYREIEEELRQETERAGGEGKVAQKKELKEYLQGKLKPGLKLQGEYANLKFLPWLFAQEGGTTPDTLAAELIGMGYPIEETDEAVRQLIKDYFQEDINKVAGISASKAKQQAQAKLKAGLAKKARISKPAKPERQETLVGRGTVINTPEENMGDIKREIQQEMPFTLLGNKGEVLARLSKGLKSELIKGIEKVYDLFGGSKGYRIGLFQNLPSDKYHLNEFSDERYNYYKNIQDPKAVEIMKVKVKELRNELIGRIADAMDIPRDKYSSDILRQAINKWMSRGESDMRNAAILKIIQNFGNEQISQAVSDKFQSPESSAIYYFLQNMSVYGISKQGEAYKWSQGILRDKITIRDNMGRIEQSDRQLETELNRDKNIQVTQEDAWKMMDRITAEIQAGKIDPKTTAVLVDPQYLNPTAEEGTYTVGLQDTTWEGHKKNLEQHLLPLIQTGVKIIYTNNEDMDLTNWLKANNLPFNVEISVGRKIGGRDEIISFINYELPEVYTGGKSTAPSGYEPGEITGESKYYAEFKAERQRLEGERIQKQAIIDKIKNFPKEKGVSQASVARLKQYFNIRELKDAKMIELNKLIQYLESLEPGDKFISENKFAALYDIIKEIPDVAIMPTRILFNQLGEKTEPLGKGIVGKISLEMFPVVDIKQESPYVKRVIDKAEILINEAEKEVSRRDEQLEKMLTKAEKARNKRLLLSEKLSRVITPQNKEIFQALSGQKVDLTQEEVAVVTYLKNFFAKVRRELELEKFRKHYVTHLEQPLMEKIVTQGLIPAVANIFKLRAKESIPIDIMLELDNIIGREKFFRFALQRKGGITPTTNIRRIVHAYSQIFENKKALDEILPEGQALVKTLLQPKTAMWMKHYLQNLKGRGLDFNFRTGRMGWIANIADYIVDIGYLKLLGLNYWSALKNLVAGEANSFIYQDFFKYLKGKQRMVSNPKKLFKMAKDNYVLEGTYSEYSQKGISNLRKVQHYMMIGQQAGEYEIRGSLFAGELTEEEWQKGEISPQRLQDIKDTIAITQGIFSKTQSPLWMQTWYGRMFMQMNRWRVTNTMLIRRLANGTREEIKRGKPGKNTKGFIKALILYGIAMWLEFQLAKAGYKKSAKVAQSMGETINNLIEIVTMKPIVDSLKNNPTISVLSEIAFSIQELANYIRVPGVEEPRKIQFQKGIEKTWIAPIERTKELFGEEETPKFTGRTKFPTKFKSKFKSKF